MKKFLSLVLALVMTMSLVTVSAGAKDFTDSTKIQYTEAVDVMSAVKVIDGYTDGSFNPTATLTRGAAAKIICNLILGPTTASALVADAAPYKDVPTNHTFAGYIAYCQKEGIISGYADGTFKPANSLTGYAFMKMLLGALGYKAEQEGYTGANWSINVAKRALNVGLSDDLVGSFNGVKAVNREEACLYAFNTLKATMVEYDKNSTVTVGNITIKDTSAAKEMANTAKAETIKDDNKMQFAEKYFTDLKLNSNARDDFARPANQWKVKAEEIGTYAQTPDATYTKKVEAGDIYKDLGLGSTVKKADVTIYQDGVELEDKAVDIKKGDDTKIGNTDKGMLTEVFYDDDADAIEVITINYYVGEINKTVKATAKKDAYVVIDTESVKPVSAGTVEFETDEAFEDDAYVVYTYSQSAKEVKSVSLAKLVSGEVTRAVNSERNEDVRKSVTIDGTVYDAAKNIDGVLIGEISVNNDYDIYLDEFGYMIYIEETESVSGDYALVKNTQNKSDFNGNKALLVFADGTEKVVNTAKDYKTTGTTNYIPNGTIVTYKADSDNVYTLKPVKKTMTTEAIGDAVEAYTKNNVSFGMTNDKAGVTLTSGTVYTLSKNSSNVMVEGTTSTKAVTTNSKTVFVVYDKSNDEYTAYTGIKNAPSITAAASKPVEVYAYCKSNNMATIMFLFVKDGTIIEDDNNSTLFLAKESVSNLIHDKDGDYFEYAAYVNGELKTVKVDVALGKALNGMYKTYSVDKYGVITKVSTDGTSSHGYAAYTNGNAKEYYTGSNIDKTSADYTVKLNGKTITVDDNAKIFAVDKDGNITESSYRSIAKDSNDKFYAIVEDYLVKTLFIEEVEDPETPVIPSSDAQFVEINDADLSTSQLHVTYYVADGTTVSNPYSLAEVKALLVANGYTDITRNATTGEWSFKDSISTYTNITIDQVQVYAVSVKVADSVADKLTAKADCKYAADGATVTVTITKKSGNITSDRTITAYESDGVTTIGSVVTVGAPSPAAGSVTGSYTMTAEDTILVVG